MEEIAKSVYRSQFDKIIEPRLKKAEKTLERLARRSRKKITAVFTPYPISNAVFGEKVEGPILRYFFPCEGKVTKGAIDFGKKPKVSVTLTVELVTELGGESKIFVLDRRLTTLDFRADIKGFSKLTASISYESEKPEQDITEVWLGFLWVPTMKDVETKSFLFEDLENDLDQEE